VGLQTIQEIKANITRILWRKKYFQSFGGGGLLKENVYKNNQHTLQNWKKNSRNSSLCSIRHNEKI